MKNIEEKNYIFDEETRKIQREYFKKWRAKNKDKVKKYNMSYWQKEVEKSKNNLIRE